MTTYLRNPQTGVIFPDVPAIASVSGMVRITEEEAFPERFAPVELKDREAKVQIKVAEEVVAAPDTAPPELVAEASKRPFGRNSRGAANTGTHAKAKPSFSGLLGD